MANLQIDRIERAITVTRFCISEFPIPYYYIYDSTSSKIQSYSCHILKIAAWLLMITTPRPPHGPAFNFIPPGYPQARCSPANQTLSSFIHAWTMISYTHSLSDEEVELHTPLHLSWPAAHALQTTWGDNILTLLSVNVALSTSQSTQKNRQDH